MPAADRNAELDTPKVDPHDTASAETLLPLPVAEVLAFLDNPERLMRINPQLAITSWETMPCGFRLGADNESNGRRLDTLATVERHPAGVRMRYAGGLRLASDVSVFPHPEGARLVVTDTYPQIEDPLDPRVADVDKSLVSWVAALRSHLLARHRWGGHFAWRWWRERFMLSMPPRQRRIVRLLLWTTALEFAVFVGLVLALRFAS